MLNSKTRELIALQEEAQARLAETRKSFVEGMKIAKEVKADLDYVHRKVRYVRPPPLPTPYLQRLMFVLQGSETEDGTEVSLNIPQSPITMVCLFVGCPRLTCPPARLQISGGIQHGTRSNPAAVMNRSQIDGMIHTLLYLNGCLLNFL